MKFTEEHSTGSNVIHSYSSDAITINGQSFTSSLVVGNQHLNVDWPVQHISDLTSKLLMELLEHQPEVILIGTGNQLIFPEPSIYIDIVNQGVGIEFMDSGAACRTYNILMSEDRRVIAGIIFRA